MKTTNKVLQDKYINQNTHTHRISKLNGIHKAQGSVRNAGGLVVVVAIQLVHIVLVSEASQLNPFHFILLPWKLYW